MRKENSKKSEEKYDKFFLYSNIKQELSRIKENVIGKNVQEIKEKVSQNKPNTIVDIAIRLEDKKLREGVTSENTYTRNVQTIRTCESYGFTTIPIKNVTKAQIERFLDAERVKSNSTLDKEYRILKNVYEYAEYKKLIKENFFVGYDRLRPPKSFKQDRDIVALTNREECTLKRYISKHPSQYNNIILLCLYTGMRIGEVLALTIDDISFDKGHGSIYVTKSLTRDKDGKIIMGKTTKTKNGRRKLELIPKSRKVIENVIKENKVNKQNKMLFLREDGKFYTDCQVNGAFKRMCRNAGIKVISKKKQVRGKTITSKISDVNVHMLRHTFATRCIEAGVAITVLQKVLGHSNIQTTINIYGDIYDYYRQKEIKKYDKYMKELDHRYKLTI